MQQHATFDDKQPQLIRTRWQLSVSKRVASTTKGQAATPADIALAQCERLFPGGLTNASTSRLSQESEERTAQYVVHMHELQSANDKLMKEIEEKMNQLHDNEHTIRKKTMLDKGNEASHQKKIAECEQNLGTLAGCLDEMQKFVVLPPHRVEFFPDRAVMGDREAGEWLRHGNDRHLFDQGRIIQPDGYHACEQRRLCDQRHRDKVQRPQKRQMRDRRYSRSGAQRQQRRVS